MTITVTIAFLAGLISFLSPCVLPLIPGYISYISGSSFDKIKDKEKNLIFLKTIFFTLGFSFVFIALGSTASFIGSFFLTNSNILRIIAGVIIIFFSLNLLKVFNFNFMNKEVRFYTNHYSDNLAFPLIVGMAFAFGWTPCIGPMLGSILILASTTESISQGVILLSFYSLGLGIPFILSGYLIQKFILISKNLKKKMNVIEKTGGTLLLLTGFLIITDQLQILGFYLLEYLPFLGNIG